MVKVIKWLIFTNIYIAIAAVCFQAIIFFLSEGSMNYSYVLGVNTFFATWFIYQFSRINFHKNYEVTEEAKKDEIYQFVDQNQLFIKVSIAVSFIGTVITCFLLKRESILFLGLLGFVSLIYSLKIGSFKLRSIPFLKIFLIAFVWAGTAVVLPFLETIELDTTYTEYSIGFFYYIYWYVFCFLFILFITLPFDINDIEIDKKTEVKTIPSQFGTKQTNILIGILTFVLSLILYLFILNKLMLLALYLLIILGLSYCSIKKVEEIEKWKVMAIYDGSMILLALITYLVLSL